MIKLISNKSVKPKLIIPAKLMYETQGQINAYDKMVKKKRYWGTRDSLLSIKQNKKMLAKLLQNKTIVELGGFDGSALKPCFKEGLKNNLKYDYINIDLGNNLKKLMKKCLHQYSNVKHRLLRKNFNQIGFIKNIKSKAKIILFLQNTFNNYDIKNGNAWIKELSQAMNKEDLAIIGFDRRVSGQKHLESYNTKEAAYIVTETAKNYGLDKVEYCGIFDELGIHLGVKTTEKFKHKNINYEYGDFIEVCLSLKLTIKQMKERAENNGFKVIKIFKSSDKHIYNLILKKN
jgi:uncharacterized SAM-dependent methyltransferase